MGIQIAQMGIHSAFVTPFGQFQRFLTGVGQGPAGEFLTAQRIGGSEAVGDLAEGVLDSAFIVGYC
ncbi:hypothetical protein D3C80_2131420 [compost metagenome]